MLEVQMLEVQELKSQEEFKEAFQVMAELRQHLDEKTYLDLLQSMTKEGYRLFAVRDTGVIVSVAGLAVITSFYCDRHVWVYDLVTTSKARSKGYGRYLMEFIEDFARQENCKLVALSSGLERIDAHRFYQERMNYDKPAYVFKKIVGKKS